MDIDGAKALKRRLALKEADEAPPSPKAVEVPADAPPVYHWTGVGKVPDDIPPVNPDEESEPPSASLFARLRLSLRY